MNNQCKRCNKLNPAEIHTCTPGMRDEEGNWIKKDSRIFRK